LSIDYILTIEYPPGDSATEDRVQSVLFLSSCLGSTIDQREGSTVVECYFEDVAGREAAAAMLKGEALTLLRSERRRVDWLELYRQSLSPIEVGRKLVVIPDAAILTPSGRVRIVIPQERAFGTGSHESTALALELLEELDLRGRVGLDIGTGSGILAIAMLKLGARKAIAFDNDFETFGILARNRTRNGISAGALRQFFGDPEAIRPGTRFDVVTMNIIAEVIEPLLPLVGSLLAPGGSLLISGITEGRRDPLLERAAAAGLGSAREQTREAWWAAVLRGDRV
jgi:ribosomal protein L11 methyltransferase